MARVREYGADEYGLESSVLLGCAIGDIIPHFGTTPPEGTLVCDGSEISRETYHELFEEIGALCGPGDGSTTFELPDLRGKWMMGADAERAAGEEIAEGLPNLTGGVSAIYSNARGEYNGVFYMVDTSSGTVQTTSGNGSVGLAFNAHNSNAIYGAQSHVTPASVAVLPCIVYE